MAATACVLGQLYNLPLYSETPFSEDVLRSTWSQACCRKYVFSVVVHSCNSVHCSDEHVEICWDAEILHLRCYCGAMLVVGFVAWFAVYNPIYPLVVWEVEFGSLTAQKVFLCSDFVHAGIGVCIVILVNILLLSVISFFLLVTGSMFYNVIRLCCHSTTLIKSYNILRKDSTTWMSPLCLFVLKRVSSLWDTAKRGSKTINNKI